MRAWTDKDVENLIREGIVPDPAHKNRLRERLFGENRELDRDDLAEVAGGTALPAPEEWKPWNGSEEDPV